MGCSHSQRLWGRDDYVCPRCKGELRSSDNGYTCLACRKFFPLLDGIPDFVLQDFKQGPEPALRRLRVFDILAPFYESWFWYPLFINAVGGLGSTSRKRLIRTVAEMIALRRGSILDAACGPGTLSRHMASPCIRIHGIDLSLGMLRKGVAYARRDGISMRFARARVEALPFRAGTFDAAVCGGALHLFGHTVEALAEMGRTLKPGAPLAVTTLAAGKSGLLRFRKVRDHAMRYHGTRIFEVPELEASLFRAGFEGFEPRLYGSFLVFRARRKENS